jgi:hypothetical protein
MSGTTEFKEAKAQAKAAKAYAKAQRPFYKKKRFIVPVAIVAVIVIAQIAGGGGGGEDATAKDTGSTSASTSKQDAPKAINVQAKQILKEFEDNEAAADAKYDGKVIAVTGIVSKIDTEIFDDSEYVVQVGSGSEWDLWTVNCDDQSQDVASGITSGQKVTVTGDFEDGGDLGIEMQGCVIS